MAPAHSNRSSETTLRLRRPVLVDMTAEERRTAIEALARLLAWQRSLEADRKAEGPSTDPADPPPGDDEEWMA
jgi:hypothetical protein